MRKRDLCDSTPSPGPFPEASGKGSACPGIQIKPRTLATNEVSSHYLLGTTSVSLVSSVVRKDLKRLPGSRNNFLPKLIKQRFKADSRSVAE